MYSNVHNHIKQKILKSTIETYPYSYMVVDNFFPQDFYGKILENVIPTESTYSLKEYDRVGTGYSEARKVLKLKSNMPLLDSKIRLFWENLTKYINNHFKELILQKYNIFGVPANPELLFTKDFNNYQLGPHTDSPTKILTCLIYLPSDLSMSKYGTSIYLPKDSNFKCPGGPHHKHSNFNLYKTIDFIPNRMFSFLKNDISFHGVEPITDDITRNLLIFDLRKTS